jgi:hypothetical protein
MRKKFESGSKYITKKKKEPSKFITKKEKEPTKYITKKKKKIDIGKIAANAMKKGAESKYITRKKKKFDLADLPSLQKKKTSKFITKKSPQEIREREMIRSKKMGGGMMGRRFGMKKGSKFPDLTGDGKVTFADILKGRGVINGKKKGKK